MPYKDKDQQQISQRAYYLKNRERIIQQNLDQRKKDPFIFDSRNSISQIKRRYGIVIELDDYLTMFYKSNGKCDICGNKNKTKRRLAIDHCHKTKKLRGLLCDKCNRGIGFLDDNIEIMEKAIEYIKKYETKI